MSKPTPFAFIDALSETKRDVIRQGELREADYVPFMTNRSLSYHADAVLYANDMNCLPALPKQMQFDYLFEALRARRRKGSKWAKPPDDEAVVALQNYYGYGPAKAREAARTLRHDQIDNIKKLMRGAND